MLLFSGFGRKPVVFLVSLTSLLIGCASITSLSGGDKDVAPPQILKQIPENSSTNFNEKQLRIYFNEYIQLNNPQENILISPPLKAMPEYTIQGKSVIIKFNSPLDSNATYIITCNEAIKDLTEGNPLPQTQFVFSTGNYVDSLSLRGCVKDAVTLQNVENVGVILHRSQADSALMAQIPDYFTVTDKNGHFEFRHLAEGEYALSALLEKSRNYLFDQKTEKVAFSSQIVKPYYIPPSDTTRSAKDSTSSESEKITPSDLPPIDTLYLFEQTDTAFRFLKRELRSEFVHTFAFHGRADNFALRQVSDLDTMAEYLIENNPSLDTIMVFFTRNLCPHKMDFELVANGRTIDTIVINPSEKSAGSRRRGGFVDTTVQTLKFVNRCNTEFNMQPRIEFALPVERVDLSRFILIEQNKKQIDTIPVKAYFSDSNQRFLQFDYPFKEQSKYSIICPDSMFFSHQGWTNDSIMIDFSTKSAKDYGSIKVNYKFFEEKSYILELMRENLQLVQQDFCTFDKSVTYPFLLPGKYKIRVIVDENRNRKWDSGVYLNRIQPEKMVYFSKTIEVLPNWKIEETFEVHF